MGPIEVGIPCELRVGKPPNPVTERMREMKVSESFVADTVQEMMIAKRWQSKMRPKRFVIQKIPNVGWRVWRLE